MFKSNDESTDQVGSTSYYIFESDLTHSKANFSTYKLKWLMIWTLVIALCPDKLVLLRWSDQIPWRLFNFVDSFKLACNTHDGIYFSWLPCKKRKKEKRKKANHAAHVLVKWSVWFSFNLVKKLKFVYIFLQYLYGLISCQKVGGKKECFTRLLN